VSASVQFGLRGGHGGWEDPRSFVPVFIDAANRRRPDLRATSK
jgi:hypothetical protein